MIIQNYIYKELTEKLLWVLGLLVLVLIGNKFVIFLEKAAQGSLPSDLLFIMLGYKILAILPRILPISLLFAVLLAFSRMAHDKELIILSLVGVSQQQQLAVVMRFSLFFCLLAMCATFYLSPWAEQQLHTLTQRAIEESDITGIQPGRFKQFSQGDRVIYVQKKSPDQGVMKNVFLHIRQKDKLSILTAEAVRLRTDDRSGYQYIVFSHGRRSVGEFGLLDYQMTEYDTYAILDTPRDSQTSTKKLAALKTSSIFFSENPAYQSEFYWRSSLIIACIILPFLAMLVVRWDNSGHRYWPFIIALIVYIIYSNLLSITQTLLKQDILPISIGICWVHLLLIASLLLAQRIMRR